MFGVRWQHYELWSGTVNLSSLAVIKDEKDGDADSEKLPPVLVKCQSKDVVCIYYFTSYHLMVDTIHYCGCV